jgi:hypothetical protein
MYRPSCLIEAHGGYEKSRLVCSGLLANHIINLNFIFLAMAYQQRQNEWQVLWIYSAANQSHSAAMDKHWASKLA